jgi:hypothetical protein
VGGRTYFGPNDDPWRLQGYTAYGFDDDKFKYGLSGNGWSIRKEELFLAGNRRDIEQIGASLTTTNDVWVEVLLRHHVLSWSNGKLTNINLCWDRN